MKAKRFFAFAAAILIFFITTASACAADIDWSLVTLTIKKKRTLKAIFAKE